MDPSPTTRGPERSSAAAKLLDPDRALDTVLEHVPSGRVQNLPVAQALGLRLAEPLVATLPQPPFNRALMDGFAVKAADAGALVQVAGEIAAGAPAGRALEPGTGVEIMTGAPCPPGTEAVVKVEDTERQGDQIRLPGRVKAGQHLQPAGELCEVGETVLASGSLLSPLGLAAAVACGRRELPVLAPPSIAIVTTGDELGQAGDPLGTAQIYDTNGPMLEAMARRLGVPSPLRLHASDDAAELSQVIERAAEVDLIVLSGGVSMGKYDLVPRILQAVGARKLFHKVRQRPGKPLLFAARGQQLIFGLPGTPLGSHLGLHRYVAAAIRKWMGAPPRPEARTGRLSGPLKADHSRFLFRLVRVEADGGGWRIDPLRWRGSSDVVGPALANAYCRLDPGAGELPAGTELRWEPIEACP